MGFFKYYPLRTNGELVTARNCFTFREKDKKKGRIVERKLGIKEFEDRSRRFGQVPRYVFSSNQYYSMSLSGLNRALNWLLSTQVCEIARLNISVLY